MTTSTERPRGRAAMERDMKVQSKAASVVVFASVLASACSNPTTNMMMSSPCATSRVVITTSDFRSTGQTTAVATATRAVTTAPAANPDQDSVPAWACPNAYLIERGLGKIKLLDRNDPTTVVRTYDVNPAGSTGSYASNPQAILPVADNKIYVVLGATSTVGVIDPTQPVYTPIPISLVPLAHLNDLEAGVDASAGVVVGNRAYVALGRYYFMGMSQMFTTATLAVIDTSNNMLVDMNTTMDGVQGIDLPLQNPVAMIHEPNSTRFLVVCAGLYANGDDGGILEIDTATPTAVRTVISESALGGTPSSIDLVNADRAVIVVNGVARALNVVSGDLGATIVPSNASNVAIAGGMIVVGGAGPIVRVFSADTMTETTMPAGVSVGMNTIAGMAPAP